MPKYFCQDLDRYPHSKWAAFNHAKLICADAKAAFLQCDGQELQDSEPNYARAHDDVARALEVASRFSSGNCESGVRTWERTTKLVALGQPNPDVSERTKDTNRSDHLEFRKSKISQPTLRLIKETNKLVSDVKRNELALTIYPFSRGSRQN